MQRDLGNEVIVAIAAVGILAFAITFAIILSLSNTPEATATATIPSNSGGGSPVSTSVGGINTEAIPTEDSAATFTAIAATIEALEAPTNVPGETLATEPTASIPGQESTTDGGSTSESSSASLTPRPTRASITPTPRKPTATSSFTPSPVPPSATPSPKPSKTATPTPTLTRTPRPTETSGIRPTPTGLLTPDASLSPNTCVPPQGWVIYVVGHGDTLLKIARAVGSSLFELQQANCLQDINNIVTGTPIYVPRLPVMPINPIPATGDPVGVDPLHPEGCTDPNSLISNLQPGQVISGVFNVMGTANLADFWYYKLEVRPDFATVYNFYSRSETAVDNGSLGQIDQSIFGVGVHWIKLTVIGKEKGATPCAIPVIFQ